MSNLSGLFRDYGFMDRAAARNTDKFLLWVDAVGGYWVSLAETVTLGQPACAADVDIPLWGDLSKRHARICRDGEGYVIEAIRPVWVDGHAVSGTALLADGMRIQLGEAVQLLFRRPHALSATARLEFASHHRTQPSVDAVLLMAGSCILGPGPYSHVVARNWPGEVVLYRQEEELYCRAAGSFEIDGTRARERAKLARNSRVAGEGFSFSLEPL
jgi:hypothetical protein